MFNDVLFCFAPLLKEVTLECPISVISAVTILPMTTAPLVANRPAAHVARSSAIISSVTNVKTNSWKARIQVATNLSFDQ